MNVLIVDDDEQVADALGFALKRHGHEIMQAPTGAAALSAHHEAQMILLDLELPDLDGQEVCRRLRMQTDTPIIVVTGRSDEVDRVMALHLGADDYMVKPFSYHELLARIDAVTRRASRSTGSSTVPMAGSGVAPPAGYGPEPTLEQDTPATLRLGELHVDLRARRVFIGPRQVRLTRKEFDLLTLLMEDSGAVRTREEIITKVWDENWYGSTRTLDVHVGSLRNKLGDTRWIETVRGVGYRIEQPRPDAAA